MAAREPWGRAPHFGRIPVSGAPRGARSGRRCARAWSRCRRAARGRSRRTSARLRARARVVTAVRSMPASAARRSVSSAAVVLGSKARVGVAVIGEGAQGGLGHGVDDVRGDQLLDVEHVGVGGVLGGGARPQRSLRPRAGVAQGEPARVGEAVAVAAVREAGVGDRDAAAQVGARRQQRVGLGIDARDEERGDRGDRVDRVAARSRAVRGPRGRRR